MRPVVRFVALLVSLGPAVAALAAGCGSTSTGTGGAAGGSSTGSTTTGTGGLGSSSSGAGGNASGSTSSSGGGASSSSGTGGAGSCLSLGAACASAADCCSGTCAAGVCNLPACTSDNQPCGSSASCCSGQCTAGACAPLNTSCKTLNNDCGSSGECCSLLCSGGKCQASSFCVQIGDVCSAPTDCCSGVCAKAAGATLGTCGPVPGGAANCGLTDGMLCGGTTADGGAATADAGIPSCGGACCSRLCAPYGPTGVLVCQPATGCHVTGDLCTKDGDCCGSAGLPGGSGQPVACDIAPGNTVGVCRNPMGCKPDGNICRLATMSCNASCDCCSGNCQNQDTCHLDNVGVPRCGPAQCAMPGDACASSASCCNAAPCVPNPTPGGMPPFICYQGSCVPSCGTCTVNADCCPGETCAVPIGSTQGVCGPCNPPPDGGTTSSSSSTSSGSSSSGSTSSSTSSGSGDGGVPCSLYGQQCGSDGECCNSVPCSGPNGPCQAGQVGCTCHFILN